VPTKANGSSMQICRLLVAVALIAAVASAQEHLPAIAILSLPNGPVTQIASPDGSHILYGVPYQSGVNDTPQLWMEDVRTQQRHMLLSIAGTLTAVWSPDGSAFSVEDHRASDSTRSYIYDASTLQRLDLADRILESDPGVKRFAAGHAYFAVDRWQGAAQVVVRLHGHTDRDPVVCFDFRYRVSRSGAVEKRSQRAVPMDGKNPCDD